MWRKEKPIELELEESPGDKWAICVRVSKKKKKKNIYPFSLSSSSLKTLHSERSSVSSIYLEPLRAGQRQLDFSRLLIWTFFFFALDGGKVSVGSRT